MLGPFHHRSHPDHRVYPGDNLLDNVPDLGHAHEFIPVDLAPSYNRLYTKIFQFLSKDNREIITLEYGFYASAQDIFKGYETGIILSREQYLGVKKYLIFGVSRHYETDLEKEVTT